MKLPLFLHNFLRPLMLPLYEIDQSLPQRGTIIDLGSGEGVIATFISIKPGRTVIAVDQDQSRLDKIKKNNIKIFREDITKYQFKNASGVLISDVLHHLDRQGQKQVLKNISSGLKKGGVLIIKEIDTSEFVRSSLSRFWDFIFYPKDKINYWNSIDLKKTLEKLGFFVVIKRPNRLFPGSTTLFVCHK